MTRARRWAPAALLVAVASCRSEDPPPACPNGPVLVHALDEPSGEGTRILAAPLAASPPLPGWARVGRLWVSPPLAADHRCVPEPLPPPPTDAERWVAEARAAASDPSVAPQAWLTFAERARRSGWPEGVVRGLHASAVHARRSGLFAAARCLLGHAERWGWRARGLEAWVHRELHRARLDLESAPSARWVDRLGDGIELARRMNAVGAQIRGLGMLGETWTFLGEWRRARDAYARAEDLAGFEMWAGSAYALGHRTWFDIQQVGLDRPSGDLDLEVTLARSRRAASFHRAQDDVRNLTNELANQAFILLELGRLEQVETALAEIAALDPERRGYPALFAGTVEGWLALRRGRAKKAAARFRTIHAAALARVGGRPDRTTWPPRWGEAAALRAQGRRQEALRAYRAALDELLEVVAEAGAWVGAAFGSRRRFLDDWVGAMVEMGETEAAFEVAALRRWLILGGDRLDRIQAAPPPERDDGPADPSGCLELEPTAPPPPRPNPLDVFRGRRGQMRLGPDEAFVLSGAKGAFVLHRGRVRVLPFGGGDLSQLGRRLPKSVRHVYLAGEHGEDRGRLDLLRGGFTVSLVPHLGVLARDPVTDASARVALFGTGANFPTDRAERSLVEGLGFRLVEGESLSGPSALDPVDTLYFSGHGELDTGSLWDSRLVFAPGRAVDLRQWLQEGLRARLVVLSACDTGTPAPASAGTWFGFGEGLLVAGADTVLAAAGEVDATRALRFVMRFIDEGGLEAPALAYRRTVLGLAELGDPAWSDFVLFGRRGSSRLGARHARTDGTAGPSAAPRSLKGRSQGEGSREDADDGASESTD